MINIDHSVLDSLVSELTSHLQSLKKVPSSREKLEEYKVHLVKGAIQDFVEKGDQSGVDHEEIRKALAKVYGTELLLSKEVYECGLEKLAALPQLSSSALPALPEQDRKTKQPLFCDDTVYHASLCCYAVNTRDSRNFKDFFKDFPSHCFDEASISVSRDKKDVDRYVIARKGKTYFVAFLSEPQFSQWPELFESFEDGKFHIESTV